MFRRPPPYMKKVEFLEIIYPPIFWIFRQIWGFYKNFFGFSAKFRDFIRIFKKAIPTTSLAFRMYAFSQLLLILSFIGEGKAFMNIGQI